MFILNVMPSATIYQSGINITSRSNQIDDIMSRVGYRLSTKKVDFTATPTIVGRKLCEM